MPFSGHEIYFAMIKRYGRERRQGQSTFFQNRASREELEADLSWPLKVRK